MSKKPWIKSGPQKGTRSPYGGPAKTARGTKTTEPMNQSVRYWASCWFKPFESWAWEDSSLNERPPRGMQGGE